MGRHRTPPEKHELGERARALRADGRSRHELIAERGVGDDLLSQLLQDTAVPVSLRRPDAKDDVRARAVELRRSGATYDQIAAQLGVSKSSCSLWLRHLPRPEADPDRAAQAQARRLVAIRARAARDRDPRDAAADRGRAQVASFLGIITSRDLVLAAAVSYWCEGAKRKPWNRAEIVTWRNSEPVPAAVVPRRSGSLARLDGTALPSAAHPGRRRRGQHGGGRQSPVGLPDDTFGCGVTVSCWLLVPCDPGSSPGSRARRLLRRVTAGCVGSLARAGFSGCTPARRGAP